jgi:glycosyltransferase A (GT-A) superfamily protein (DUF2064 family)
MTNRAPDPGRSLLMIAARSPIAGETKTRLGQAIGMEAASELYCAFLNDLADRFDSEAAASDRLYDLAWTYSPPDRNFAADLEATIGRPAPASTIFVPQEGIGWGTRQLNLLRWGEKHGYARTVLMASDSPHLLVADVECAFQELETRDVVIGRVRDGGYYLIGMRRFVDVLSTVQMSTASAAEAVVHTAESLGLTIGETAPTFDVDEVSDLAMLVEILRRDPALCPTTLQALTRLRIA